VSGSCFHENTTITYKGDDFTLTQLENAHPECTVPHVVTHQGHIITAKCGQDTKVLRLTPGHLVYSNRGLQAAMDLTKQDTLYADLRETIPCTITHIAREEKVQNYFGLNCLTSEVLASGLKSSTFEKLHSIPSFWMAIMGRILGVKRASQVGDYVEKLVTQMNLL
jgi:hypothetical protein